MSGDTSSNSRCSSGNTALLAVAHEVLTNVVVPISWWGEEEGEGGWQRWQQLCVLSVFSYIHSTTNANTQATVWPRHGAWCTHTLATRLNDIPSNIADRPNHLHCNFKSHPAFPAALSSPLSITTYLTICKTNRSPIFHFFNHCIHNTSLYTHFAATILTHLYKFTLYTVFLDQLSWSRQWL
jgi:hypothetical protein